MREELEKLLKEQNFTDEETEQLFNFIKKLSPSERQTVFSAIKGFPEYLPIFKNILMEKLEFIKQPSQTKLSDILNEEEVIIESIITAAKKES